MSKSKKILRIVMFILGAVAILPAIKPVDSKIYAASYGRLAENGQPWYVLKGNSSGTAFCCCTGTQTCGAVCCTGC